MLLLPQIALECSYKQQQDKVEAEQAQQAAESSKLAGAVAYKKVNLQTAGLPEYQAVFEGVVDYVCTAMGVAARTTADAAARAQVSAAVESAFPLSGVAYFLTLPAQQRLRRVRGCRTRTPWLKTMRRSMARHGMQDCRLSDTAARVQCLQGPACRIRFIRVRTRLACSCCGVCNHCCWWLAIFGNEHDQPHKTNSAPSSSEEMPCFWELVVSADGDTGSAGMGNLPAQRINWSTSSSAALATFSSSATAAGRAPAVSHPSSSS